MRTITITALAAALLTLPAAASAQGAKYPAKAPAKNIVQVAVDAGSFTTLVAALKATGLDAALQGKGPFTVFAPTDAAFAKLPKGTVEALLADKEKLASILTYHVVSGKVMAGDIVKANGAKPATLNTQAVDVVVRDGKVYVNNAQVVSADIAASNGVIHVIDTVLLPAAAPAATGGR
jgi:transforming growth factor-beta-induced protein